MSEVAVQIMHGSVAVVQLQDAERRNAFSPDMRAALKKIFLGIEASSDVRAVVVAGGERYFCVGGDINSMGSQPMGAALERMRGVHELVRLIGLGSKPTVAAIEGWTVGAGLALAMLCDTVVASGEAKFKAGFGDIGMLGDSGILYTLPNRVGHARAKRILFYNEVLDGRQAEQWGLVDVVVEPGQALAEALKMAQVVAAKAPLPIALTKSIFGDGLDAVLGREREVQAMLLNSDDHQEGRRAFFEKRTPVYAGR